MYAMNAYLNHGPDHPVLIVEDDVGVRESLAEVLADEGYDVATASNGREALDWLGGNPPPCLILLDLWMPVMGGEEFREAQLSQSGLAPIPLIVISAAGDGRARAATLRANDFIPKPIDIERLLQAISTHC